MSDPVLSAVLLCIVVASVPVLHLVVWHAEALDAAWGPWRTDYLIAPP